MIIRCVLDHGAAHATTHLLPRPALGRVASFHTSPRLGSSRDFFTPSSQRRVDNFAVSRDPFEHFAPGGLFSFAMRMMGEILGVLTW